MAIAAHAMIRVLDAERSLDFYARALGLEPADRYAFPDFTLIYLRNAEDSFELELTINHGRTAPYELGDGYGHLAFTVGDLAAARTRAEEAGCSPTPTRELRQDEAPLARFFFLTDPDGYRIEVIERAGRFVH